MSDKRNYGAVALEMTSIAVAIILGFAVSNWDERRREASRADAAVERISRELEANADAMRELPGYYSHMIHVLDSIISERGDGRFERQELPGWQGLRPPMPRTASFQLATSTGALQHVDFSLADDIVRVYEVIESGRTITEGATQALLAGSMTELSDIRLFFTLLSEQVTTTVTMIDQLDLSGGGSGT